MDSRVQASIQKALQIFEKVTQTAVGDFGSKLAEVFDSELTFMEKVSSLDAQFESEPRLEGLREVFFDLLLINFFTEDVKKLEEDYLESQEWEDIEDETIDRGTELLNLLLYLRECADENIEPELEDYLKEFLLVDEDEFQDEHRIYEDIIANQILVESSYEEISRVGEGLSDESEIKDLFYPIISFFHDSSPTDEQMERYLQNSKEPDFDGPVYGILVAFNQGK